MVRGKIEQKPKEDSMISKRKPKRSRRQAVARRRQGDLKKRRRPRFERRRRLISEVKRRRRILHHYRGHRRYGLLEGQAASRAAASFDCSVATVRRYAKAYEQGGLEALKPSAPGPTNPSTQIPFACQLLVVTMRTLLGWCGQRIAAELERRGVAKVSHSSIYKIFHRYHLKVRMHHPKAVSKGINYKRFEREHPNELWHVDFKGPLQLGRYKVYLFVIEDDHSRYVLDVHVALDCSADTAIARVQRAFELYGMPQQLMSDNGAAFATVWEEVEHRFDQVLSSYGVEHLLIAPYYPETNGKVEAFIKTLTHEALALLADQVQTPQALQQALDVYLTYYNNYRAHSSLGYNPPVKRFLGCAPKVEGLAAIWALPDLGCPHWTGWAEPPPSPVKALVVASRGG